MNLKQYLNEADAAPDFAKYLKKAEKHVRSELSSLFKEKLSPKLEVKVESAYKARVTLELQRFAHPKDIDAIEEDFKFALEQADVNGHIFKIELGNSNGPNFVEALVSGLRPGMTVKAEAFFPTFEYEITFKQIMKK